jgi:hypothetical protein
MRWDVTDGQDTFGAHHSTVCPEMIENRRGSSRRSEHMVGTSTLVRNTGAPGPAYRPTRGVEAKVTPSR